MAHRLPTSSFRARTPVLRAHAAPRLVRGFGQSRRANIAPLAPISTLLASPVTDMSKRGIRRNVEAQVAYHPSLDIPVHDAVQQSMDLDDVALDGWIPGEVFEVTSVQQVHDIVVDNADRKVILMCKSRSCRPCKAFSVKYKRLAAQHTDTAFLTLTGESSAELRNLMIDMQIRNTPTFLGFWKRAIVHRHSGISKERMETVLDSDWQQLEDDLEEKDVGDSLLSL